MKKLFIPNENNEYQPHFLRDRVMKYVFGLAVGVEVLLLLLISPVFTGKLDYFAAILPSTLVELTNESRESNNLGEVEANEKLWAAAQLKAYDMAHKGYFAHTAPDGKTPWYWLNIVGYKYEVAGENLAVHFVDSEDVHRAWMDSPGHRANILRGEYEEIGIATAEGVYEGRKAIFVVQYFGKPRAGIVAGAFDTNVEGFDIPQLIKTAEAQVADIGNEGVVEKTMASPRTLLSSILLVLLVLVAFALVLKIAIRHKVQFPELVANGALVMVIILTFVYLNAEMLSMYTKVG